jgi:AAA domain/Bifunctional DNA primase/polymerase, N-terminal
MKIPTQLKNAHFVKINYKSKICEVKKWPELENQIDYNELSACGNLKIDRTNYGVVAWSSKLVFIDIDDFLSPIIKQLLPMLPATFSIKTGHGYHLYYNLETDRNEGAVKVSSNSKELFSIRKGSSYVMGPGSIHPEGLEYMVHLDIPIADITKDILEQLEIRAKDLVSQQDVNVEMPVSVKIVDTTSEPPQLPLKATNDYSHLRYEDKISFLYPEHGKGIPVKKHLQFIKIQGGSMLGYDLKDRSNPTVKRYKTDLITDMSMKKELEIKYLFDSSMLRLSVAELEKLSNSINYINNRFLASGKSLLIAADSHSGKSVLTFQLLIGWSLGKSVLNLNPHLKLRSLYLGNEDDCIMIQNLFTANLKMAKLSDEDEKYASDNISIPDTYGHDIFELAERLLAKAVSENNPFHIVVINPMSNYITEDLNSSMASQNFYSKIDELHKKYNVASVVICHNNKQGLVAGNKGFENKFRAVITLAKESTMNDCYRMNILKGASACGFKEQFIKFNDILPQYFYWLPVNKSEVPTHNADNETDKKILNAIPFGPKEFITMKDIEVSSGIKYITASRRMPALVEKGIVHKCSDSYPHVYYRVSRESEESNDAFREFEDRKVIEPCFSR